MEWHQTSISDIKVGDYVRCEVFTYSQKWMERPGYEEYNMTSEGQIVSISDNGQERQLSDILIDGNRVLGHSPGSSGGYTIWVKVSDN